MLNHSQSSVTFEKILFLFLGQSRKKISSTLIILFLVGIIFTPLVFLGCIWFYVRWYNRFTEDGDLPSLVNPPSMAKAAMVTGGVVILILLTGIRYLLMNLLRIDVMALPVLLVFLVVNLAFCISIYAIFNAWVNVQKKLLFETTRHGSAKLSKDADFMDLKMKPNGIYVGNHDYKFDDNGHILTVAGTRGGKAVNLLISNLLGAGEYRGSWVVIDPKGELYAVTAKYQSSVLKNKVIVLDPWETMASKSDNYNPLDLIDPNNPDSLVDDAKLIAKMIVPDVPGAKDPFWDNRARSWITGFIIHIMLHPTMKKKDLVSLWRWLRVPESEFMLFVKEMSESKNKIVQGTANEIISAHVSDKMFSSIMANVFEATDFLSSPSLQNSLLTSSFNVKDLTDGKTTLYVIIPADRLDSQSKWLRLIVSTSLTSSIRNRKEKITFMMDEFSSLGKMEIVESFMGISSGYGITLWPVIQNLTQLKINYGENWQTFIGNAAVRHYFSINDNFTADYVSKSIGVTTYMTYIAGKNGQSDGTQRAVMTPDEVRSNSADNIFMQYNQRNTIMFPKAPYYLDPELIKRADENPYSDHQLPDPKNMMRIKKFPNKL